MRGHSGFSGAETKLKREKINGKEFDIYVDTDGRFYVYLDKEREQRINTKSLKELPTLVRAAMRKAGLKIPVTVIQKLNRWHSDDLPESYKFEDGVLTGIHATRRSNALVRSLDNRSIDLDYDSSLVRRLTADERQEFLGLVDAVRQATVALRLFQEDIDVNAEKLVDEATRDPEDATESAG